MSSPSLFFVKPAQSVVLLCAPQMNKLGEKVWTVKRCGAVLRGRFLRPLPCPSNPVHSFSLVLLPPVFVTEPRLVAILVPFLHPR